MMRERFHVPLRMNEIIHVMNVIFLNLSRALQQNIMSAKAEISVENKITRGK